MKSLKRYDYRCIECGWVHEEEFRETMFLKPCEGACDGEVSMHKRLYTAFYHKPMMPDHFNHAVGAPISSMRQFKDRLNQKSDEHANELGMDVNYQPVDMGDPASVQATGEKIYETNVKRSRDGDPLLREIKGEV